MMQIKSTQFPEAISISDFADGDMAQRLASHVYSKGVAADFTALEQEAIEQTCTMFLKTKPDLFQLVQRIFSGFFRVQGGTFSGASYPHAYGFYFTGDKFFSISTAERCLSLVHELAHQELFLLNLVDRLVEKAADHQLRFASFQGKARPPIGRLHSLAAIFRMLQFSAYFSGNQEFLKTKFKETRLSFEKGELTEFGELLVSNMENYLGALSA